MLKISTVILNWNRPNDTIDCIRSLIKLSLTDCELSILIVDNASDDDSIEKFEEIIHNLKINIKDRFDLKIIKNKENFGFAAGNNAGIKYALRSGADHILILNNDTRVDKHFLSEILKASNKFPNTGIYCPKIYFEKGFEYHKKRYKKNELGKVIWAAGGNIDWDNMYAGNRGVDEVDRGQFYRSKVVDFASGACMLVKREVFESVGMFDEKYYMYLEDADLCLRAKNKGFNTFYVPKSKIWHKVAQSSSVGSELNDYFITRNRLYFGMVYAPLRTKIALVKESIKLILNGRKWQRVGVKDFYLGVYGRGSWR